MACLLALVLGFGVLPASQARADVVSAHADAVKVTVYRDGPVQTNADEDGYDPDNDTSGLAFIVETRTVDLPAGRSRIKLQGVADGIIPESASVAGLPHAAVERNFDYDLLGPGSLIARSVGQTVKVVRTNRRTGKATEEPATIRSGPAGVMLDFGGGRIEALHCSGDPEKLVFDHAPADLAPEPTLSVVADVPAAGRYTLTLGYLTVRLNWGAAYVARIAPDGHSLALTGWITLANHTAMSFANAPTAVVAGRLSRVEVDLPDTSQPAAQLACWPMGNSHHPRALDERARRLMGYGDANLQSVPVAISAYTAANSELSELVVTAEKRVTESQLGDYKLYTLAEPTTVAARQTKQVAFLAQPAVKFETVYRYQVSSDDRPTVDADASEPTAASIVLLLENKPVNGLGRALPSGAVRLMQAQTPDGPPLLVGEPAIERDVPVGEPFEIIAGQASDVQVTQRITAARASSHRDRTRVRVTYEVRAANAKGAPVTVQIRQSRGEWSGFRVSSESSGHGFKAGDPLWRLTVPAGAERVLTYSLEYETD